MSGIYPRGARTYTCINCKAENAFEKIAAYQAISSAAILDGESPPEATARLAKRTALRACGRCGMKIDAVQTIGGGGGGAETP